MTKFKTLLGQIDPALRHARYLRVRTSIRDLRGGTITTVYDVASPKSGGEAS